MSTLTGVIRSAKTFATGFTIAQLDVDGEPLPVTLVGALPRLTAGESIQAGGEWTAHPRYGRQFKAESVTAAPIATLAGLVRYLGGGIIPGVGAGTAQKIVDAFGQDALRILDAEPERLTSVPGIGQKKAAAIAEHWQTHQAERAALIWLQGYGASPRLALKIFRHYGAPTIATLSADPYQLETDIPGVGFLTADRIARAMGVPTDAPQRVAAGMSYVLEQAAGEGHVYLPLPELAARGAALLGVEPNFADDMLRLRLAYGAGLTIERVGADAAVYLAPLRTAEAGLAERLQALMRPMFPRCGWRFSQADWSQIEAGLAADDLPLTAQQASVVQAALTQPLTVLTGGPGTGKTHCLRALSRLAAATGVSIAFAAPTGRASRRLAEATGQPATTIHRLLEVAPEGGLFNFKRDERNPLNVDLVVIDEASMIELVLMYHLLKAIPPGIHLLLVGDVDQLPSVGAGNVLRDVITAIENGSLQPAQVIRLSTIFRQAAGSHIVTNAHRVNAGQLPVVDDPASLDFFLFRESDPVNAAARVVELVTERIPSRFGIQPAAIQVLSPLRRGEAGIDTLNQQLQARLNPKGADELPAGDRVFRPGDRVMQLRNNYESDIFNGDMGIVLSVNAEDRTLAVDFEGRVVPYQTGDLDDLTHAYAVTIHKAQGSEFPVVVMPLLKQHYIMLQRNLLYTGITRARRLVVLVGETAALALAVRNNQVQQRYSGLVARLQAQAF